MEIKNAKIKNVTVDFLGVPYLGTLMELESQFEGDTMTTEKICFDFSDCYDLQLFKKIREYTEAKKIDEMKGKIIRLVYFSDFRVAFGDAIYDKFVYFEKSKNESETIKELSESDLQAKYDKLSAGPQ